MKNFTNKQAEVFINKVFDTVLRNEYKEYVCPICGKTFTGYGNNPRPAANEGRCCDDCNKNAVIPARLHFRRLGLSW